MGRGLRERSRKYAPALKARFSPDAPFGIGLRLSARDAARLLAGNRLAEFRDVPRRRGLYVAIINGFPYGPFHGTPVKAAVYAPDWRRRRPRRLHAGSDRDPRARLLPAGLDGGVSTAPLSYKPWMAAADAGAWDVIIAQRRPRRGDAGAAASSDDGTLIHLDIEPEPDCSIENTAETLDSSSAGCCRSARRCSAARSGSTTARRASTCSSTCASASTAAISLSSSRTRRRDRADSRGRDQDRARAAQLRARRGPPRRSRPRRIASRAGCGPSPTRPTCTRSSSTATDGLRHYLDLPDALEQTGDAAPKHWRIHFHVPLFAADYDRLGSTQ